MAFLVTDEGSDLAALARFYQIALGREADGNGLAFWAELVEGGTITLAECAEAFLRTREGQDDLPDSLDDDAFVTAVIEAATGQSAEDGFSLAAYPDPVASFAAGLADGSLSRGDVLALVAATEEAQAFLSVTGESGLDIADFAPATFGYGVASGDPDASSVVLWTHARPADPETGEPVEVVWEVATDEDFSEVVATGTATATAEEDYTVKAIAEGLEAGERYFYRFAAGEEVSPVGRTSTLPEGSVDQLTFALFSCANYPGGFFTPYAAAAERGFDVSIHVGDYIYEYGIGEYASGRAEEFGRTPNPTEEILTVEDYETRYAQYTRDADLQAVRAAAPMIMMWDDHETANDSWATGAENHDPETEGDWFERRDAALEAYHRWNPTREPEGELFDYDRSFEFGDLLELTMFETRLQARDETRGDLQSAVTGKVNGYVADPASFGADVAANPAILPEGVDPTDPAQIAALAQDEAFVGLLAVTSLLKEAADPAREMVGPEQIGEFAARVAASDATWQVIGSQTLMARMDLPGPALTDPDTLPAYVEAVAILLQGGTLTPEQEALFSQDFTLPYNLDSWDGYQAEREAILETLAANEARGIVLSGDTHNAWFSEIATLGGETVAFEFGGPGVSSPGLETFPGLDTLDPAIVAGLFVEGIDTLRYADTAQRGYVEVVFEPEQVTSNYVFVDAVDRRDFETEVVTQTVAAEDFDGLG